MINSIEMYAEAGRKAGEAVNHGDEGLKRHFSEWARRAIHLESGEAMNAAREAYENAYRAARNILAGGAK